jgi:glycosyltransferase involved in cell wall biosynthesis
MEGVVPDRKLPQDRRVLIISHDVVGIKMAGPGIRYWELARVLARRFSVILAVPNKSALKGDRFRILDYDRGRWSTVDEAVADADVIIACGDTLSDFPILCELEKPLVIDAYDPHTLETLEMYAHHLQEQSRFHRERLRILNQQCLAGDFFICASERQRDWWLGLLEANGRINPYTYGDDRTLRRLIDVVPFGLPSHPPQHKRWVLKGVYPHIAPEDKVLLWGGGVWEWLDPLTLVRALSLVLESRRDVKLVFPGTRHPNVELIPDMPMRERLIRECQGLGLLGKYVFLGEWVPYEEWPNYLLESDIGISLHFNSLETHLAFRSRVLDYIWAGLPMVVTGGDVISEFVEKYDIGIVVDYEDVVGIAKAILNLLKVPKEAFITRFKEARKELAWEKAAEPLIAFCLNPHRAPDKVALGNRLGNPISLALKRELVHKEAEIERLRTLIKRYERGKFIRFMKKIHQWKSNMKARLGRA